MLVKFTGVAIVIIAWAVSSRRLEGLRAPLRDGGRLAASALMSWVLAGHH